MSFCNFNTAVWNCRVRLWTNFLLITFDFGVNTNFISDCRVQIFVCMDPVMGEYVCVVWRFTEKLGCESGEREGDAATPHPPLQLLRCSRVVRVRHLVGEKLSICRPAGGSWSWPLVSSFPLCVPFQTCVSKSKFFSLLFFFPCYMPSTYRCAESIPAARRI